MIENLPVFHKIFGLFLGAGSYVTQAGLEVVMGSRMTLNLILLPLPPKYWNSGAIFYNYWQ